VTNVAKQKDAAGLGALAHAYHEGDRTMLASVPDERMLKIVSGALERPKAFFEWVSGVNRSQQSMDIIRMAQQYLPVASWPWDKACILAGALLATTSEIPPIESIEPPSEEFPYWVALDKHTAEGKVALRDIAKQMKSSYRQLIWTSFYCESARVNKLSLSPWFDSERSWRLRRAGLSFDSAGHLWSRAKPLVSQRLNTESLSLKAFVEGSSSERFTTIQHRLL
jgi:hypothetical protein